MILIILEQYCIIIWHLILWLHYYFWQYRPVFCFAHIFSKARKINNYGTIFYRCSLFEQVLFKYLVIYERLHYYYHVFDSMSMHQAHGQEHQSAAIVLRSVQPSDRAIQRPAGVSTHNPQSLPLSRRCPDQVLAVWDRAGKESRFDPCSQRRGGTIAGEDVVASV